MNTKQLLHMNKNANNGMYGFIKYTENTPASKLPYSRSESEGRG